VSLRTQADVTALSILPCAPINPATGNVAAVGIDLASIPEVRLSCVRLLSDTDAASTPQPSSSDCCTSKTYFPPRCPVRRQGGDDQCVNGRRCPATMDVDRGVAPSSGMVRDPPHRPCNLACHNLPSTPRQRVSWPRPRHRHPRARFDHRPEGDTADQVAVRGRAGLGVCIRHDRGRAGARLA
jgi:hypothetical protein